MRLIERDDVILWSETLMMTGTSLKGTHPVRTGSLAPKRTLLKEFYQASMLAQGPGCYDVYIFNETLIVISKSSVVVVTH